MSDADPVEAVRRAVEMMLPSPWPDLRTILREQAGARRRALRAAFEETLTMVHSVGVWGVNQHAIDVLDAAIDALKHVDDAALDALAYALPAPPPRDLPASPPPAAENRPAPSLPPLVEPSEAERRAMEEFPAAVRGALDMLRRHRRITLDEIMSIPEASRRRPLGLLPYFEEELEMVHLVSAWGTNYEALYALEAAVATLKRLAQPEG
jgi:hypothetical protein